MPKVKNLVISYKCKPSFETHFIAVKPCVSHLLFIPGKTLPISWPLEVYCFLLQLCILVDLAPVLRGINCKRIFVLLFSWIHTKGLR